MNFNYWGATDGYVSQNGGPPTCTCGQTMFAEDDHGRFRCLCGKTFDAITGGTIPTPMPIPQVDVTGMSDAEKAKIPTIYRLNATPTAAEAKVLSLMSLGPDALDDPEYWVAMRALEKERSGK